MLEELLQDIEKFRSVLRFFLVFDVQSMIFEELVSSLISSQITSWRIWVKLLWLVIGWVDFSRLLECVHL